MLYFQKQFAKYVFTTKNKNCVFAENTIFLHNLNLILKLNYSLKQCSMKFDRKISRTNMIN